MRRLSIVPLIASTLLLVATSQGWAKQLPDLRGQTLFISGTFFATGCVLGVCIEDYYPNGFALPGSKILIDKSGPEDNSELTGLLPLPPINSTVHGVFYPGCPNPSIPLAGKFNRNSGAFVMAGSLAGTTTMDFGVTDTEELLGIRRILLQVKNLKITLTGTGKMDKNGQFVIEQPGSSSLQFDVSFLGGTPKVALQDPLSCGFGGVLATLLSPTLKLSNWTARFPLVAGNVTLEGCPQTEGPITLEFRPINGDPPFTESVPLSAGAFQVYNIPAQPYTLHVKGPQWLAQNVFVDTTNGDNVNVLAHLLIGDINDDNHIDIFDLATMAEAFFTNPKDKNWNPAADLNCDASVDILDLGQLAENFNLDGDM